MKKGLKHTTAAGQIFQCNKLTSRSGSSSILDFLPPFDWDETKQFFKCKRHVLSRDLCQWTFRALLHGSITIKEIDNKHDNSSREMNKFERREFDSIRPVLASGAVFVFIFTFQFYRYR